MPIICNPYISARIRKAKLQLKRADCITRLCDRIAVPADRISPLCTDLILGLYFYPSRFSALNIL